MNPWVTRLFTFVMVALAAVGLVVLGLAVPGRIAPWIIVGPVALVVLASWPLLGRGALALAGGMLLGLLALLTVAILVRLMLDAVGIERRLPVAVGLALGFVAFGLVAFWYLLLDWEKLLDRPVPEHFSPWPRVGAAVGAFLLAVLVVLLPPIVLREESQKRVAQSQRVVAQIDARIVSATPRADVTPTATAASLELAVSGASPPYSHAAGFKVRYSVGFRDGDRVRWTLTGAGKPTDVVRALASPDAPAVSAPAPLADADPVGLLLVDGTPAVVEDSSAWHDLAGRSGEATRWRRVAAAAAPPGTPSYALLETKSAKRLRDWQGSFIKYGTAVRRGAAVSVQGLASQSVTDAAVRLAVASTSAQEDFSLALKHRPILLFDSKEAAPRPLDIEALFRAGKVKLCTDQRQGPTACEPIKDAGGLRNGGTHLDLDLPAAKELRRQADGDLERLDAAAKPAPPFSPTAPPPNTPPAVDAGAEPVGAGSTIYVRAVPIDSEDARYLYLDYWWYLPYNPAGSGSGAFCGPGLLIPGISCFDHVSDWEGVTVVLERTDPRSQPKPIAVHYAQHASVVRYDWDDLTVAWHKDKDVTKLRQTTGAAVRPVVFVASGTHAAYPTGCTKSKCRQPIGGAEENRHNGKLAWVGNGTVQCGRASCLKMLPTARGGRDPALWNAFQGPWGKRNCFMTYYCDSSSPPAAPGQQDASSSRGSSTGSASRKQRASSLVWAGAGGESQDNCAGRAPHSVVELQGAATATTICRRSVRCSSASGAERM